LEGRKAGQWHTGHAPIFPRWLTLENHRLRWTLARNRIRTSHAFDFEYFGAARRL